MVEPGKNRAAAATPANWNGDGFSKSERSITARTSHNPNKRQKLDVARTDPVRSSSPVDLTGEDDMEVVGLNGGSLPSNHNPSKSGQDRSTHFQATEFNNVNAMTSTVAAKRRRKSKDGQGSSQTSSHGTHADASTGYARTNGQSTKPLKDQILDKELEDDKRMTAPGRLPPPINLGKGLYETKRSSSKQVNI